MKFLDPTNDFAFKKVFGNEQQPQVLISFLNSILGLEPQHHIVSIALLNPSQVPHIKGAKETLLDIRCTDQQGHHYIVEMQVLPQKCLDQRVLNYASRTYAQQLKKGEDYSLLKPVIFIGVLNFKFTENPNPISTHLILDVETREHRIKDFQFTFIELPKFNKSLDQLTNNADKWIYFLKQAKHLDNIPEVLQADVFTQAFETLEMIHWSEEEYDYYERRHLLRLDELARIGYGYDKGKAEGKAEGIEIGEAKGKAQIIHALAANGLSIQEIANMTALSVDEVTAMIQ